jgi:hypothetical protein
MNERIVDFGSTLERYHDSFLLSRWQDSDGGLPGMERAWDYCAGGVDVHYLSI